MAYARRVTLRGPKPRVFVAGAVTLGFLLVASIASAGPIEAFNVDYKFDAYGREHIDGVLIYDGLRGAFYLERDFWEAVGAVERDRLQRTIRELALEFDGVIWPRLTEFWGREPEVGANGSAKTTVLISQLASSAGGYFNTHDILARADDPFSNERKMLHLNTRHLKDPRIKEYLAHEFQHLITLQQKDLRLHASDDVWLNEARSEYSPTILGYDDVIAGSNLEARMRDFMNRPADALTEWREASTDYAAVNMFSQYLADRFGTSFLRYIMNHAGTGFDSIDYALGRAAAPFSVEDIVLDWSVATVVNDVTLENGRYGYRRTALKAVRQAPVASYDLGALASFERNASLKEWAPTVYELRAITASAVDLSLNLEATPGRGSFLSAVVLFSPGAGVQNVSRVKLTKTEPKAVFKVEDFGSRVGRVMIVVLNTARARYIDSNSVPQDAFRIAARTSEARPTQPRIEEATSTKIVIDSIMPRRILTSTARQVIISGRALENIRAVFFGETRVEVASQATSSALIVTTPSASQASRVVISLLTKSGERINAGEVEYVAGLAQGTLVRALGDDRVYVIAGSFKRHIVSPKVFSFYREFKWSQIREVAAQDLALYEESRLIRRGREPRIFEVTDLREKRWLNMTGEKFLESGRRFDAVFTVNNLEFNYYRTGPNITQ